VNQADVELYFNEAFDAAIAADVESSGFPVSDWFMNGPSKPEAAIDQWRSRGPQLVRNFIEWYERSDYEIWIAPDGRPAIELDLRPTFGDITVQMYVDLVLVSERGLTVLDLKSGSRKPTDWLQPSLYASGIELTYGIRPLYGAYFHAKGYGRAGDPPKYLVGPMPLTAYELSVDWWTRELARTERAIDAQAFFARVGKDCDVCPVSWACTAVGGVGAERHDPDHPQYTPF
jgi:hypothetical protein